MRISDWSSDVCSSDLGNGIVAKYRKLHPFISKYMSSGDEYCVFDLIGWKCGILICYDNNIIENVRVTSLLGDRKSVVLGKSRSVRLGLGGGSTIKKKR